jgi:hypothetical protein
MFSLLISNKKYKIRNDAVPKPQVLQQAQISNNKAPILSLLL